MILINSNKHFKPVLAAQKEHTAFLSRAEIAGVANFYNQCPNYHPTPLYSLPGLAGAIGIKNIYVKDESARLGLDSFKALGGFYAIARLIAEKLGEDFLKTGFGYLSSGKAKKVLGEITFATATDGNHGKGVAMAATSFGHRAAVYLPRGSRENRVKAIEEAGGSAYVTEWNYDDTVRYVFEEAKRKGYTVVQDTVMEGYRKTPGWIMQGYALMAKEIIDSIEQGRVSSDLNSGSYPTHVILQAGVGSMPASVTGYFLERLAAKNPHTIIVEPENAACFFKSAAGDGSPKTVSGDLETIMAGLACGVPNPVAWEIIKSSAKHFLSLPDWVAARGVRILKNPLPGDPAIISGESGSIGSGFLSLFACDALPGLKEKLGLDKDSVVLVLNTEGVTDPITNCEILWDGKYPTPAEVQWKGCD